MLRMLGPHKNVDYPNHMQPRAFKPLCDDCRPRNLVSKYHFRVPARIPHIPATSVNMIETMTTPMHKNKEDTLVMAITKARAQD